MVLCISLLDMCVRSVLTSSTNTLGPTIYSDMSVYIMWTKSGMTHCSGEFLHRDQKAVTEVADDV